MSQLVSVGGVACLYLFTSVFLFYEVATAPLTADICDVTNPVFCPKYGICCSGIQFCYQESGTCEECFPLDIKDRKDRLKFCSDIEMGKKNRKLRHVSCIGACITLFNLTEIKDYEEPAAPKTTTDLIQEYITKYNSSVHKFLENLKEEIDKYVTEHNSSVHKLIEKLKVDIDDQTPGNKTKEFIKKYINEDTKQKGIQASLIIAIIALIGLFMIIVAMVIIIKLMMSKVNVMLKKNITTEVAKPQKPDDGQIPNPPPNHGVSPPEHIDARSPNPPPTQVAKPPEPDDDQIPNLPPNHEAESPLGSMESLELLNENPTQIEDHLPHTSTKHTKRSVKQQVDKKGETELKPLLPSHGTNDDYDDKQDDQAESNYQSSGIDGDQRAEAEENYSWAIEYVKLKIEAFEQKARKKEHAREIEFKNFLAMAEKQLKKMQEEKSRVEQDVYIHHIDTATGNLDSRKIGGYTERDTVFQSSKLPEMQAVRESAGLLEPDKAFG